MFTRVQKKGYKKVKATLISPPGEVGRSNAPPASPPPTLLSQLPEMLYTVEAQSSGIHIHTAQLCVLEEPIQRENLAGGNSSWRLNDTEWIRALGLGCSLYGECPQLVHECPGRLLQPWKSNLRSSSLPALSLQEPELGKQGWGRTGRCQPGLGSAPVPGQQVHMG